MLAGRATDRGPQNPVHPQHGRSAGARRCPITPLRTHLKNTLSPARSTVDPISVDRNRRSSEMFLSCAPQRGDASSLASGRHRSVPASTCRTLKRHAKTATLLQIIVCAERHAGLSLCVNGRPACPLLAEVGRPRHHEIAPRANAWQVAASANLRSVRCRTLAMSACDVTRSAASGLAVTADPA
jgi:hypothetical protein